MSDGVFLFREATWADEDAICDLARYLNTLNLPPEPGFIHELLGRSIGSFDGSEAFDSSRRFLFVVEDPNGRVIGTSMVHAQHGTYEEPHVYFTVSPEERHARLPISGGERLEHVHMEHTMLFLAQTYHGPSEVGGLVLHPDLRRHPQKLGRLLSLARFVFIAAYRPWIRDTLLAELLPPLFTGPEGNTRSPLWDALGHRFTGLSYEEADRLSRLDKDFIWDLFPRMPVHASLLPEEVQSIIGTVGPKTIGALRLLESVGFKYQGRVDPFDGGPHVEASTDEVTLVRDTRRYGVIAGEPGPGALPGVVGVRRSAAPHFAAAWAPVEWAGSDSVKVAAPALRRLGLLGPEQTQPKANAQVLVALRPQRRRADRAPGDSSGA